jgi:small ligand-binding sensory domain FIST
VNKDKSITYSGTVPEGAKVRFSMPPGSEIIDYAIEQMTEFNQQIPISDAVVLFSCKGRHIALGQMVEYEISSIRKLWNVPLVGFFTFGEIGPVPQGRCDFHGYTLVPVLIYEK